jgi:hypothetical protein
MTLAGARLRHDPATSPERDPGLFSPGYFTNAEDPIWVCASACVFPWLAGTSRTGKIGFHHVFLRHMAEECSGKLGRPVTTDTLRPLQACDAGGRARAMATIVEAMAAAKEAGIDPDVAARLVGWDKPEG